ncbi:MAG: 2Fe-2S ferredoxin [Pseudomonadota bacterium]
MPRVSYRQPSGEVAIVEVPLGDSVMDGALDHNVPGILGQCGGGCTCCTCHCYVEPGWADQLPAPHPDELDLLEYALGRRPTSRLACQLTLTEALDGLEVEVPERQLP